MRIALVATLVLVAWLVAWALLGERRSTRIIGGALDFLERLGIAVRRAALWMEGPLLVLLLVLLAGVVSAAVARFGL